MMVMFMGEGRDDTGAELMRLAMGEFEGGDLLQMVVQEPGMVEQALQNQRLPARHRAALAAQQRTCRQLRTRRLIGASGQAERRTGCAATLAGDAPRRPGAKRPA